MIEAATTGSVLQAAQREDEVNLEVINQIKTVYEGEWKSGGKTSSLERSCEVCGKRKDSIVICT
jgi:hypothetical protein